MFNTITDMIEELEEMHKRLIEAQQQAEELYISAGDEEQNDEKRRL